MLRFSFSLIVFFALLALSGWPIPVHANSCEQHQQRLNEYNQKRRAGGSNRQMNDWLRKRNYHRDQLAECIRLSRQNNIQTTSGNRQRRYDDRQSEIKTTATDERVIRLYQTCNFWIREHNQHATGDTLAPRNAACNSAQKNERELSNSQVTDIEHVRTLKDCIKPGNLIDNEVSACLQGKATPVWNSQ